MNLSTEQVKEHFNSVAEHYFEGYFGHNPLSHLFLTRLQRVSELLGDLSDKNILSIGSGPGMSASIVLPHHHPFWGVDISLNMLRVCQKLFMQKGQLNLTVANMGKLAFCDASFDGVLCLGAIEYARDLNVIFREISRVLKYEGYLIVSMQNKHSIYRWWDIHVYSSRIINRAKEMLGREPIEKPLEIIFSLKEFQKYLVSNHFEITDVVYYDFNVFIKPFDRRLAPLSVFISEKLERFYHSRLGFLATGYIVKCHKLASDTS